MINDGGAERMVRKRKVTWWQIVAVAVMALMTVAAGVMIYFLFNPAQMVNWVDRSSLKDGYDILYEIREQYQNVAVYGYRQTDEKVRVEFRYYEEVLEEKTDLIALSYQVKTSFEQYLADHPDYFICAKNLQVELRFPDVIYRNYSDAGERSGNELAYVCYEYSGISAGEFSAKLDRIRSAKELRFAATEEHPLEFGKDADFAGLADIAGLEKVRFDASDLTEEQKNALVQEAERLGITVYFPET